MQRATGGFGFGLWVSGLRQLWSVLYYSVYDRDAKGLPLVASSCSNPVVGASIQTATNKPNTRHGRILPIGSYIVRLTTKSLQGLEFRAT